MDAMDIANTLQQIKNPVPGEVKAMAAVLHNAFQANPQKVEVTPEALDEAYGDGRWDVTADVESLSPTTEAQHASRVLQALNMLSSPGVGRLLSLSPELLKTMLNMMGLRNAADQKAIAIALQKRDMLDMMMMQAQGGAGSPPGQKGVAPMPGGDQPNHGAGGGAPEPAPDQTPQGE